MTNICLECQQSFKTSHKIRKFCSKKCYLANRVKIHFVPKSAFKKGICPPTAWKKGCKAPPTAFKKGSNPWNKGKKIPHCSGENHPNWSGGEHNSSGYIFIYCPDHPSVKASVYVKRSRLVMEKKIRRFLRKEEVVHHINGIKTDDRAENLMLFPNNTEHMKFHFLNKSHR